MAIFILGDWNDTTPAAITGYDNAHVEADYQGYGSAAQCIVAGQTPQFAIQVRRATTSNYGTIIYDASGSPYKYLGANGTWYNISNFLYCVDTGVADAYAVTISPAPTLTAGLGLLVKCGNANSGASTIDVNGTVVNITKDGTDALAGGEIHANQIIPIVYDGTQFQVVGGGSGGGGYPPGGVDGQYLTPDGAGVTWSDMPERTTICVPGNYGAGQIIGAFVACFSIAWGVDIAGSRGAILGVAGGLPPTADRTFNIFKNSTLVATMVIATSGAFTFATVGGVEVIFNAGDSMVIVAPGSTDGTLAGFTFTLYGTKGLVPQNAVEAPFISWEGTYDDLTSYDMYNMVKHTGGTYIAIQATTGNDPTPGGNNAYWNIVAADGALTIAEVQEQEYTKATDTGTANNYAVTLANTPSGWNDGLTVLMKAAHDNTGASTLAITGLTGTKAIKNADGTDISAGTIKENQLVPLSYDSTLDFFQITGGAGGANDVEYIVVTADARLPNAVVWPGLATHPDCPPASPSSYDDEFDGNSLDVKWTQLNSPTLNFAYGRIGMTGAGGSAVVRGIYQSRPTAPFSVEAKLTCNNYLQQYPGFALFFRENSTQKGVGVLCYIRNDSISRIVWGRWAAGMASWTSTANDIYLPSTIVNIYLKLRDDGANFIGSFSYDRAIWYPFFSESRTAHLTASYDNLGVGAYSDSNCVPYVSCDWVRVTES